MYNLRVFPQSNYTYQLCKTQNNLKQNSHKTTVLTYKIGCQPQKYNLLVPMETFESSHEYCTTAEIGTIVRALRGLTLGYKSSFAM